ncbi:MAG: hypothetical protein CVV21_05600 [Candidatus Goldiibacteriota bacterium HGW-Goldbacteria-1]|jgi:hypothetical protein|nr:MAG: hypothetical protein CVV21_05600 [Candidatus Goldiibacteriota bacterium HGW-Goldbacteria-1]
MVKNTVSCCPHCLKILPAEKITEGNDVFLVRECPEHGKIKTLISRDAKRFFDKTFTSSGKAVYERQTKSFKGCPDDCGWCDKHKQHLCTALIEITGKCNLKCPVCYYGDKNTGDISFEEFKKRLDVIMRTENDSLDVLQISGGEPTLHTNFVSFLEHAASRNINRVLINTNGLALLGESDNCNKIRDLKDKVEIYLQFDGFDTTAEIELRGASLLEKKLTLINKLNNDGIKMCLAVTVTRGNLGEIGRILELAIETKNITGITFQRLTGTGWAKGLKQKPLLQEDILVAMDKTGYLKYNHIVPLPCSHENCTSISFLFVDGKKSYSLAKYIDFAKHQGAIKDKIGFDSGALKYLKEQITCNSGGCCSQIVDNLTPLKKLKEFTDGNSSNNGDMKMIRIIVKNFMDAHTFDTERAEKCCVGVSTGKGKIIPFCVNNVFNKRAE